VQLVHVNVRVRDPQAAADLYARLVAGATTAWLGDSLHLRASGVDLAFHAGPPAPAAAGSHFGFLAPSATAVDAARATVAARGLELTEETSEPGFRAFRFRDPDGYECEVYWEAAWPAR
jgi:catechol 2,3-dioxygenase-like lactoylglutathione lyase family enzyme